MRWDQFQAYTCNGHGNIYPNLELYCIFNLCWINNLWVALVDHVSCQTASAYVQGLWNVLYEGFIWWQFSNKLNIYIFRIVSWKLTILFYSFLVFHKNLIFLNEYLSERNQLQKKILEDLLRSKGKGLKLLRNHILNSFKKLQLSIIKTIMQNKKYTLKHYSDSHPEVNQEAIAFYSSMHHKAHQEAALQYTTSQTDLNVRALWWKRFRGKL